MNFKCLHLCVLALLVAALLAVPAQATIQVHSGSVATAVTIPPTPGTITSRTDDVNVISFDASIGQVYSNLYAQGGIGVGNAPGFGGSIRSIGVVLMQNYNLRTGGSSPATIAITTGGVTTTYQLTGVVALDGVATAGSTTLFTATSGRLGFFAIPVGTFNQFSPITWGATDATGTSLLAPIAVWDLGPQDFAKDPGPAAPGGGGPGTYNNVFVDNGVSFNANQLALQGGLNNWLESATWPTVGAPAATVGNDYNNVFNNPPFGLPPEGMVSTLNEAVNQGPTLTFISGDVAAATASAGFTALNTIAAVLGGFGDLGVAGTAWATAVGTPGDSLGPSAAFHANTGLPNTSDLVTNAGAQFSITRNGVPEPASCLIWMVGCGFAAVYGRRARTKRRSQA
jgi:hypothetical protein